METNYGQEPLRTVGGIISYGKTMLDDGQQQTGIGNPLAPVGSCGSAGAGCAFIAGFQVTRGTRAIGSAEISTW